MLRLRCRSTAAALVLLFALALAAPPAAAAPIAPASGSWWSALSSGLDGLLGAFGLGGVRTIRAPEGPGLEPDGFTGGDEEPAPGDVPVPPPGGDDLTFGPIDDGASDLGAMIDPNG
ncbi:MAG TPA: hypothetical protein VF100_09260 [Thermoanaerobaculia bacterium]